MIVAHPTRFEQSHATNPAHRGTSADKTRMNRVWGSLRVGYLRFAARSEGGAALCRPSRIADPYMIG